MADPLAQAILDSFPAHMALVDESGTIVAVNTAWMNYAAANGNPAAATVGVGAQYVTMDPGTGDAHTAAGEHAYRGIRAVLDGTRPRFTEEYPCHGPDRQQWFELTAAPLAGPPRRVLISHLDVTARVLLEKRVQQSAERFHELVDHLHQLFWICDPTLQHFSYISPAYAAIWGRSCQSLVDNPADWISLIHADDQARMRDTLANARTTGRYDAEYRIVRGDGEIRWIWARGYPVFDAQGALQHQVGIAEDVTARRAAADENAKLAAIIEYADDAIVSMTLDGTVISWNQGAERLYGYAAEEIIGHSISILNPPDRVEEYTKLLKRAKQGERVKAIDTTRVRKDGSVVPISLSLSPIEVRAGRVTGISKISHDITQLKHLELQFRHAQKMEAVGTLAGGVAHDFNNLLTVINGYSELLIHDLPQDDPSRDLLVEIHNAGERAGNLTRQLLAFSRKQMLEPRVLNLNDVVTDTNKMLHRLIGEDILLVTVLDPSLKQVRVDPGQLQQVLMNLAVNARDAMPQGGRLTIETRAVTFDEAYRLGHPDTVPGHYAMVSVSDTGVGMDEITKTRIFEPFFTTKSEGQGTGLGMAVVHGVVRQSGGMIEVESALGEGTVFRLYFPIAERQAATAESDVDTLTMPSGSETILLVEDEESVRALTRHILRACGYTVLEASNGLEAVALAEGRKAPIHLLVTDVVMPLLGGRQLAERLKTTRSALKVLFLSGYTDDAVVRHGILHAEVEYLQKPFSPAALARKVREVLDGALSGTPR